jgi:hypothetical protein
VIWLAMRFALRGGRQAAVRLVLIASGVAIGVVLLLSAAAAYHGVQSQHTRSGWLATTTLNGETGPAQKRDAVLWRHTEDEFGGQLIQRVDAVATGPQAPTPPGIPALPGPGQFYASPALSALLADTSANQLAQRYPGHQIGIIGHAGLASPHVLVIVIGYDPAQLRDQPGTISVRSLHVGQTHGSSTTFQQVALGLGVAGLIFPILTLVAMATRMAAARREQRLAAMRLVGATIRQVALIGAAEAAVAALAGTVGGIALFYLLRPALASVRANGDSWFTGDLSLGPVTIVAVWVGVPVAAALAAITALRRAQLSPLGVVRRTTPAPPKRTRLVPLGFGLTILLLFALAGRTYSRGASGSYAPTIVAGFVLTMAGLVIAGPWLTMAATRLLALKASGPATLIAARRLADNPAAAFRAVSGLILAVFAGTVFVSGAATAASGTALGDDAGAHTTAITRSLGAPLAPATAAALATRLRTDNGVRALTLVHAYPGHDLDGYPTGLVECAELAHTSEIGKCDTNVGAAVMPLYALDAGHTDAATTWPAPALPLNDINTLPVQAIVVGTDGTQAALERTRTTVESTASFELSAPSTVSQLSAATLRDVTELQHLADLAILLSVIIAGCSLAVAVAGSLIERRQPFALLRLSGMSLAALRRVVVLEAAVPLVTLTVISGCSGLLASELLLRALRGATVRLPSTSYYVTVATGTVLALGLVGATMPLLKRISAPENARND